MDRWKRALVQAAEAGDQARSEALLDEALAALPALTVFEQVMVPVLVEVEVQPHREPATGSSPVKSGAQAERAHVATSAHAPSRPFKDDIGHSSCPGPP